MGYPQPIDDDSPLSYHNTQFRIVSRNGQKPPLYEAGYKDTVVVNRDEVVRVLVPTGPYADAEQPYMYHCHILEHEDGGMMGHCGDLIPRVDEGRLY